MRDKLRPFLRDRQPSGNGNSLMEGRMRLMKILLESSDRDLLHSYAKLLTLDGHEVVSAFDGAQVLSMLQEQGWDLLLLEDAPPRVKREILISVARDQEVPVIVMLCGRLQVRHLLRSDLPEAYLSLPFLPTDLAGLIESVRCKKASDEHLPCGDATIDVGAFRFVDSTVRLTVQEMDLLGHPEVRQKPGSKLVRTLILALNEKLSRLGKATRLIYEYGKGYGLVNQDD